MRAALYAKYIEDLVNYEENDTHLNLIKIYLKRNFELDSIEIENCITDGSGDQSIDAVYIDDVSHTLYLFQSKFQKKSEQIIEDLSENLDLKAFTVGVEYFINEGNEDLFSKNLALLNKYSEYNEKANEYATKKGKEYSIKYLFLISRDCQQEQLQVGMKEVKIIDVKKIHSDYSSIYKGDNYPDLNFEVIEHFEYNTDKFETKVCVTSIKEFVKKIKENNIAYNDLLFENVRYSYSKSNINSAIKQTLESEEISNFYLYNNGITILCDEVSIKNKTANVINASIINGGQTTFQMLEAELNEDDGQVLIRINKRSSNSRINDEISINLNNQNNIQTLFIYSKNEVVQKFKIDLEEQTEYYLEIKENEYLHNNTEKKLNKNLISLGDLIRIFIVGIKHSKSYNVKNAKNDLLSDATLIEEIIEQCFNIENFNKVYPKWLTIENYVKVHRGKRRKSDEVTDTDEKRRLEYNFINTSNYLLLFTCQQHNINELNDNKINKIVDILYTIDELNNNVGSAISKNTQSKAVFEKIKTLDFSDVIE